MTIFTTQDCCFTTYRKRLVAKEYNSSSLKAIAVETLLEIEYNQGVGATTLNWV